MPAQSRRELKKLRAAVRAVVPSASESISYGIPTLRLGGKPLIYYAAWKHHTSLYPITSSMRRAYGRELDRYETSKGTVRFPLDKPLPISFVKKLVKARLGEMRTSRKP